MPTPEVFSKFMKKHFRKKIKKFILSEEFQLKSEVEDFQNFIHTKLPQILIDELMNELLFDFYEERHSCEMKIRILQLFLTEKTRILNLFPCDNFMRTGSPTHVENFVSDIFQIIQNSHAELAYLGLYNDFVIYLPNIKLLSTLKVLKIKTKSICRRSDAIGELLRELPALEELIVVVDKFELTTIAINSWPKHEALRLLSIQILNNFQLANNSVARILEKIPNSEISIEIGDCPLGNLSFSSTRCAEVLQDLLQGVMTLATLQKIHKIHPKIESILIKNPEMEVFGFLENLTCLERISFEQCHFSGRAIMLFLSKCGQQIKALKFDRHIRKINLTLLLEFCPNLEFLHLESNDYWFVEKRIVLQDKLRYLSLFIAFNPNIINFIQGLTELETLRIEFWTEENPDEHVHLFTICKKIKCLNIFYIPELSIDTIKKIIERCHHLEEIILPLLYSETRSNQLKEYINEKNFNIKCRERRLYKMIQGAGEDFLNM